MESTRKILRRLPNVALAAFVIFLAFKRVPLIVAQYSSQGEEVPVFSVPTLGGGDFNSALVHQPTIVVFWATWCGPCTVELARLNELIKGGDVPATAVVAISSFEDRSLLEKTARERDYRFSIGLDMTGEAAESFRISGTPTVIFIDPDRKISWMTTGLSPTLGFRAKRFVAR